MLFEFETLKIFECFSLFFFSFIFSSPLSSRYVASKIWSFNKHAHQRLCEDDGKEEKKEEKKKKKKKKKDVSSFFLNTHT